MNQTCVEWNVARGRKVGNAVKYLVNTRNLQLECPRVLLEGLAVLILKYETETLT